MGHLHDPGTDVVIDVFIVHRPTQRVLLRRHDKYKRLLAVGGHVELAEGEDPNQAAIREAKEEVGLDIVLWDPRSERVRPCPDDHGAYRELIPPVHMNVHDIHKGHTHTSLVFFATSESDEIRDSEMEPSGDIRWCTMNDLVTINTSDPSRPLQKPIFNYATMALRILCGV
jgi:8-oxo-dGTP pyrophosphatase MutT (NUDIX family)